MSGQGEMTDLRQGCSATVHAVLDRLDAARPAWARLSDATIEVEIELHTPAPDAPVAELVHGAALMIFLAERRAGERVRNPQHAGDPVCRSGAARDEH